MATRIIKCVACGKTSLSKNEVGITKKLLGMKSKEFYCLECLANFLEVEPQDIAEKIAEFKEGGCKLFE